MSEPWFQWCIYFNPSDFPGKYVIRAWKITDKASPSPVCASFDTLEEARKAVAPGRVMISRSPEDDPVIVETWI